MPEAPPRKRFQIHLSTAIVLMFVAGVLIWVNMLEHYAGDDDSTYWYEQFQDEIRSRKEGEPYTKRFRSLNKGEYFLCRRISTYGWPEQVARKSVDEYTTLDKRIIKDNMRIQWHSTGITIDIFVFLSILTAVAFACEWAVRRKGPP